MIPAMEPALYQAVITATAADATVAADQANLKLLQDDETKSTTALKAAQQKLTADIVTRNNALDGLITAAQAAKIPMAGTPEQVTAAAAVAAAHDAAAAGSQPAPVINKTPHK